jgi:hypothetical protein
LGLRGSANEDPRYIHKETNMKVCWLVRCAIGVVFTTVAIGMCSGNDIKLTVSDANVKKGMNGEAEVALGFTTEGFVKDKDGKTVKQQVTVKTPGLARPSITLAPGQTKAKDKAAAIFEEMKKQNPFKDGIDKGRITLNDKEITFKNLRAGAAIVFDSKDAGEALDTLAGKDDPTAAGIEFIGNFDSQDASGGSSTFTAGFSTDLGSELLTLDASSFSGLSGQSIADTFFSLLEPSAPSLGVVLTHLDRSSTDGLININFVPGAAHREGGAVFFGTSSAEGMVEGAINVVPEPSTVFVATLGVGTLGLFAYARRRRSGQEKSARP